MAYTSCTTLVADHKKSIQAPKHLSKKTNTAVTPPAIALALEFKRVDAYFELKKQETVAQQERTRLKVEEEEGNDRIERERKAEAERMREMEMELKRVQDDFMKADELKN